MAGSIISTKLCIPSIRHKVVPRQHLTDQLNDGLSGKLIIVSAPAGYGKTTLVSWWLTHLDKRLAWISLDDDDNDPVRFFSYVTSALLAHNPDKGETVLNTPASDETPQHKAILLQLINALADSEQEYVLVLDDYHLIVNGEVHDLLDFFFANLPSGLRVVILSRGEPALSLARLRSQNQLTELYTADLRFSSEEAEIFLNEVMKLALPADQLSFLENRLEGWIAGLQLAALSLKKWDDTSTFISQFSGNQKHISDYLMEEILSKLPRTIQLFLLETSILRHLTGSLCDAVTGRNDGAETLERLNKLNLFLTPLDDESNWYRYHALFSDFLRTQLHKFYPRRCEKLHLKACRWFESQMLADEAIYHASASNDMKMIVHQIMCFGVDYILLGERAILHKWLMVLSEDVYQSNPFLCLCRIWVLLPEKTEKNFNLIFQLLDTAERLLAHRSICSTEYKQHWPESESWLVNMIKIIRIGQAQAKGEPTETILAMLSREKQELGKSDMLLQGGYVLNSVLTYLNMGDLHSADREIKQFEKTIGRLSGPLFIDAFLLSHKARVAILRGRLHEAMLTCKRGLVTLEYAGNKTLKRDPPYKGLFNLYQAKVLFERNELVEAMLNLEKGIDLIILAEEWGLLAEGYALQLRLKQASGANMEEMVEIIDKISALSQYWSEIELYAACLHVRLLLSHVNKNPDYLTTAEKLVQMHGLTLDANKRQYSHFQASEWRRAEQQAMARLYLAKFQYGRLNEKEMSLGRIATFHEKNIQTAKSKGLWDETIELLILQAMIFQTQGKTEKGITFLIESLKLAEPESYVRVFIEQGEPMIHLLHTLLNSGRYVQFAGRLLSIFKEDTSPDKWDRIMSALSEIPVETLSKRELEVLRLMADRLSNQEIANTLYLSRSTVKRHVSNIFEKLHVHKRVEAVSRAQSLGLF